MSGVKLAQLPVAATDPLRTLDLDGPPRRYRARFEGEDYSVIVTRDNIGRVGAPDYRWHVSVAGERSTPAWRAFVAIVQEVRPGVMFCVPMPPRSHWLNLNENVMHVHETKDAALTDQWKAEGGIGGGPS